MRMLRTPPRPDVDTREGGSRQAALLTRHNQRAYRGEPWPRPSPARHLRELPEYMNPWCFLSLAHYIDWFMNYEGQTVSLREAP